MRIAGSIRRHGGRLPAASLGCLAQPGRCAVGSLALRDVELGTLFDRGYDGDLAIASLELEARVWTRLIA